MGAAEQRAIIVDRDAHPAQDELEILLSSDPRRAGKNSLYRGLASMARASASDSFLATRSVNNVLRSPRVAVVASANPTRC